MQFGLAKQSCLLLGSKGGNGAVKWGSSSRGAGGALDYKHLASLVTQ